MRVLVADDLLAVQSALALLLGQEINLHVTGQAADAAGVLRAVAQEPPDVILLDWELPGMPASDLVQQLRQFLPDLCIIALSSRPEAESAAMLAGADAFIDKLSPPDALLGALEHFTPPGVDTS